VFYRSIHGMDMALSQTQGPPVSSVLACYDWVSEQILNSTSAQLGYTVPFTTVHAGKYVTEDKSKTDTTKTKDNPEKDGWMVRV